MIKLNFIFHKLIILEKENDGYVKLAKISCKKGKRKSYHKKAIVYDLDKPNYRTPFTKYYFINFSDGKQISFDKDDFLLDAETLDAILDKEALKQLASAENYPTKLKMLMIFLVIGGIIGALIGVAFGFIGALINFGLI